jgi:hypothetical protein
MPPKTKKKKIIIFLEISCSILPNRQLNSKDRIASWCNEYYSFHREGGAAHIVGEEYYYYTKGEYLYKELPNKSC